MSLQKIVSAAAISALAAAAISCGQPTTFHESPTMPARPAPAASSSPSPSPASTVAGYSCAAAGLREVSGAGRYDSLKGDNLVINGAVMTRIGNGGPVLPFAVLYGNVEDVCETSAGQVQLLVHPTNEYPAAVANSFGALNLFPSDLPGYQYNRGGPGTSLPQGAVAVPAPDLDMLAQGVIPPFLNVSISAMASPPPQGTRQTTLSVQGFEIYVQNPSTFLHQFPGMEPVLTSLGAGPGSFVAWYANTLGLISRNQSPAPPKRNRS